MLYQLRAIRDKYRGELVIAAVSTVVGVVATILAAALAERSLRLVFNVFVGVTVVSLLFGMVFNLKRLINDRFTRVSTLLDDFFGLRAAQNQFFARRRNFTLEKALLSGELVTRVLPDMTKTACGSGRKIDQVNVILDSGTTIMPVFPVLMRLGIKLPSESRLVIYTNNLAGIDEIHKVNEVTDICLLTEEDFCLIPGQPLNRYRATTGNETQKFLKELWEAQQRSGSCQVSIGVLTANWLVAGRGLDRIALCARGRGHLEFKTSVLENSDYVVLIAPLGKILPLEAVEELNELMEDPQRMYKSVTVAESKKERVALLTSLRSPDSPSPCVRVSNRLGQFLKANSRGCKNYTVSPFCPRFDPPGTPQEIVRLDVPNDQLRRNLDKLF